jgi:Holliday junction resolvase RusA-like endonuclease
MECKDKTKRNLSNYIKPTVEGETLHFYIEDGQMGEIDLEGKVLERVRKFIDWQK